MGRVSLLVEANTSIAIGNISKLGEAIKNAMAKFDSKALTTWEKDAETKINKVGETINKLGETLQTFKNNLKADASFGASKALTDFKRKFEDSFKTLDNFKTYFKEGYTFGATTQVETFKTKIAEVKEAIGALNAELSKQTTNQAAKGKKDEITKLIAAAKELNKQLEKKPVLGAKQAIVDFEAGFKAFSQNVAQNIAPALVSLNLVKTQMGELTQVLNSVQQPTWVEPFKSKMQEVVKVLQDIATAYKSVKTEIKQPVGESAARREFQMTDKQAQNLYRTTKMFYRHVRQEFKETRAAATETARAIREAMAAVNGGGTGAGGTGTATAGTRLGFGEQLFSRMRSNLYSYLTMWFGVAGAIRVANALVETHNELLEKGRKFNQTEYEALGELNLKAGDKAEEYREAAKRLAAQGFGSNKSAYQFASAAAMSGITTSEMEEIAPLFKYNIAAGGDQQSLMAAISYIKKAYGDKYSTKQIAAMILAANTKQPSNIGPTANAIQRLIKSMGSGLNIPLPDLIAMFTVGSEEEKDARVGTMMNAVATAIEARGLQAMVMGDYMASKGISGYDYYKDDATGEYRFKNAELQKQLESKELTLNNEMISHALRARGRTFLKDAGFNMRIVQGMKIFAKTADNPEEYNNILSTLNAIAAGDTSVIDKPVKDTSLANSVAVEANKRAVEATIEQLEASRTQLEDSVKSLREIFKRQHHIAGTVSEFVSSYTDSSYGADWMLADAFHNYNAIMKDDRYTIKEKENAKRAYINAIRATVKEYGNRYGYDISSEVGIKRTLQKVRRDSNVIMPSKINVDEEFYVAEAEELREFRSRTQRAQQASATSTNGAISKFNGSQVDNSYEAEKREQKQAAKDEKQAAKVAKQAEKDAKNQTEELLDSLGKATISTPKNIFIKDNLALAMTDTSENFQALKSLSSDRTISNRTGGNVLGEAFLAYASDKTDRATDQQIVEQLVSTLNEQGISTALNDKKGIGRLVMQYIYEGINENKSIGGSDENDKILRMFFKDVTDYLKEINDGTKELAVVKNKPEDRGSKSKVR